MSKHRVRWEMEIEATDPLEALKKARVHQLDPGSTARSFDVWDEKGKSHSMNLLEESDLDSLLHGRQLCFDHLEKASRQLLDYWGVRQEQGATLNQKEADFYKNIETIVGALDAVSGHISTITSEGRR